MVRNGQPSETRLFLSHLKGLLPGRQTLQLSIHPGQVESFVGSWSDDEVALLIDQANRQLDRQRDELEKVRQRAQFLFTTALGAIVLVFVPVVDLFASFWSAMLWIASVVFLAAGLLGAASVVVTRKSYGTVDATLMTRMTSPVQHKLASALAGQVPVGENSVATEITVFRSCVALVLLALIAFGASWLAFVISAK